MRQCCIGQFATQPLRLGNKKTKQASRLKLRTIASQPSERAYAPPVRCDLCVARYRALCSTLSGEQLERLSAMGRRRTVPANQYIFRDGDEALHFAAVLSGVVKLIKTTANGEQHIIGLMYGQDFLGYTFAKHHRFSAAAATETELCVFPRVPFSRLLGDHPSMERWLFEFTAGQLDLCRDWTLTLGRKSSYERVASLLLMIARRARPTGQTPLTRNFAQFELPLTRSELADYLGLTLETVSRMIGKLKRIGLIELRSTREVIVPDIARLAAAASIDSCPDACCCLVTAGEQN
jgi:CRP/FNR family transcriptional regulator, anaerobic regulatory protein